VPQDKAVRAFKPLAAVMRHAIDYLSYANNTPSWQFSRIKAVLATSLAVHVQRGMN
jgi:hypothetical protein